jgi:hypothetical protein
VSVGGRVFEEEEGFLNLRGIYSSLTCSHVVILFRCCCVLVFVLFSNKLDHLRFKFVLCWSCWFKEFNT